MRRIATIACLLLCFVTMAAGQLVEVSQGQVWVDGVLRVGGGGGGGGTNVAWGNITGLITAQTDLWTELTNRYTKAEIDAAGYLTAETDPLWNAASNLYATTNWVDLQGFLTAETDPVWSAVAAQYATTNWVTNWVTDQAYLTVEADPIWAAASNLYGRLAIDQTWTGQNLFDDFMAINTVDIGLLGIVTTNDPIGPAGPFIATNALVVNGNIVPFNPNASLGTLANPWESLFVANASIYMASNRLSITTNGDVVVYSNIGGVITTSVVAFTDSAVAGTSTNLSDYINDVPFLTVETDPVWTAVAAQYATTNWVTNWVTEQAYLTVETDPVWTAVASQYATTNWVTNWVTDQAYLTVESDPVWTAVAAQYATTNWVTNYVAWGNIAGTLANQTDLNTELTNRYTIAQSENWLTNMNHTMAPATEWVFSLASVTNDATQGTEVMNYRTSTNLFILAASRRNREINLSYTDSGGSGNPFQSIALANAVYTDCASVNFSGTDSWGIPTKVTYLIGSVDGAPSLDLRLYDVTNAKELAVYSNFTGVAAEFVELFPNATNNWPTNRAQIVIQGLKNGVAGNALSLYAIEISE